CRMLEHEDVFGDRGTRQSVLDWVRGERGLQRAEGGEVERRVAPLQHLDRFEAMALERLNEFGLERRAAPGRSEGAVTRSAAGATGNLAKLGRSKAAILIAVELAVGRKRDVIDVEIEAHSDRVGRNQIIDVARLIERYLGIAGARRERTQDDG